MPDEPTTPAVNEHGYPDATPVAEMATGHQAAYWKYQSRKHEQRASQAPDAAELEALRAAAAELSTRKAADLSDTERLQKVADDAKAEALAAKAAADAATSELLKLQVAGEQKLSAAQARWLVGTTKEELEASAAQLLADFAPSGMSATPAPRAGGARGSDVGGTTTVDAGAELYRQRHNKN